MRQYIRVIFLCGALLGCQTIQTDGGAGDSYNIFFTQADHIKELLAKGEVQEASNVYSRHASFFLGKGNTHNELLRKLRTNVEDMLSQGLNQLAQNATAQSWPVARDQWADIASLLAKLREEINQGEKNAILTHESPSTIIVDSENAFNALKTKITDSTEDEFKHFDLINGPSFSEIYPVNVNMSDLFASDAERILADIGSKNTEAIRIFKAKYGSALSQSMTSQLNDIYFKHIYSAIIAKNTNKIEALIEAIKVSKDAGFGVEKIDTARIKAIDITSKTLLNAGQIDFPIQLEPDLPIEVIASDLDEAVARSSEVDTEILVLIDVAAAKVNREIQAYEPVPSEHQIGTKSLQNPGYATAQNSLVQAQMTLQSANMGKMNVDNSYCQGWGCLAKIPFQIAAAAKIGEAQKSLTEAMSTMQSTPMMLEEPVYASYEFRKASIDASKLAIVNYYVIEKNAGKYIKGTFDAKQSQSFSVPYNMRPNDRNKSSHLSGLDTEEDIKTFEEKPFNISLMSIIQEYVESKQPPTRFVGLRAIREQILKDKNIAIARFQADRIKPSDTSAYNKLAQSVVVVHSLKGKLGTGFYVNDDLVMTNFHVVEDSTFVEMTLKDGTETFGKVVAKDIRLDLALVRTQHRGTPVKFHNGDGIEIGATTFAIGHPQGLKFSVTRGIVSAIRAHKNVNFHAGKEVYFVQTDTPINSGNSGGPLFLDDLVIGVNDWVFSKQIAEGLNFAIHVKEVLKFLKKHEVSVSIEKATS